MSDDTKQGGFVVIPLAWLAAPNRKLDEILCEGFDWGVMHFLNSEETRQSEFEKYPDDFPVCKKSSSDFKEYCLSVAQRSLRFKGGSMGNMIDSAYMVDHFLHSMRTNDLDRGCNIRLRTGLLFDVRNALREGTEGPMTENQFRVFAGAVSLLGDKPYSKIGAPMFQARAAGLLSPADLERAKPLKMHGPILTRRIIDRALEKLVRFGWLKKCGYGNGKQVGERFWSHRLSDDELRVRVGEMKLKRITHLQSLAGDLAFSEAIRAKVAATAAAKVRKAGTVA